MIKTFFKILLFLIPFILISLLMVVVDPYNLFKVSHLIPDEDKFANASRFDGVNPRCKILWNTLDFMEHPTSGVLIGNSRTFNISNETLSKTFGIDFKNLAIHGGDMRSSIDLFWMADEAADLKLAIMQLDFNNYYAFTNVDQYSPVRELLDKPSNFFFKWDYLTDCSSLLYYHITRNTKYIDKYVDVLEDHWDETLEYVNYLFSTPYHYPQQFYDELQKIANHCMEQGIKLYFVIAPSYYELNSFVEKYNLTEQYQRFKSDLAGLSPSFDMNDYTQFTMDKSNFSDHVHLKKSFSDSLVYMMHNQIMTFVEQE